MKFGCLKIIIKYTYLINYIKVIVMRNKNNKKLIYYKGNNIMIINISIIK